MRWDTLRMLSLTLLYLSFNVWAYYVKAISQFYILMLTSITLLPLLTRSKELLLYNVMASLAFVRIEPSPFEVCFPMLALLTLPTLLRVGLRKLICANYSILTISFLITNLLPYIMSPYASLSFLVKTVYVILVAYVVWLYSVENPKYRALILDGYLAACLLTSILTIQTLTLIKLNPQMARFLVAPLHGGFRVKGFFKDPNVMGAFLIPGLILSLVNIKDEGNSPKLQVVLTLLLLSLAYSFSRAAYLGALLSYVVLALLTTRKEGKNGLTSLLLPSLIALSATITFLALYGSAYTLLSRAGLESYDYSIRFSTWRKASLKTVSKPLSMLTGWGPGSFERLYYYSSHNTYLRLLVENGLAGLLTFSLLIIYVNYKLFKACRSAPDPIPWALLAYLIGFMANSFFIDALHWRHLWIMLGLGFTYTNEAFSERPK